MGKPLADALANGIIRDKADEIMEAAESENHPTYLLAWLVREQATIMESIGSDVASLRLESHALSLRDHFAVHAPPMPDDWYPQDGIPTKPSREEINEVGVVAYGDLVDDWERECWPLRASRWPWHYADLCLSNREPK